MKSFEEWLIEQNDRVYKELNVTSDHLLDYLANSDIKPIEDLFFFYIDAFVHIADMSYEETLVFLEEKVKGYKRDYFEQCRKLRVIKGGLEE